MALLFSHHDRKVCGCETHVDPALLVRSSLSRTPIVENVLAGTVSLFSRQSISISGARISLTALELTVHCPLGKGYRIGEDITG